MRYGPLILAVSRFSGVEFKASHCSEFNSGCAIRTVSIVHSHSFRTPEMAPKFKVLASKGKTRASSSSAATGVVVVASDTSHPHQEFAYMRNVTTKVDVFSFGIVMMELFTRIRLTGTIEHDGEHISLQEFVEKSFQGGVNAVLSIMDDAMDIPTATQGGKVVKVLKLALSCTLFNAEERPVMKEVLSTLLKLSHV
ncbi:uncharacterized protein A4U43_C06F10410 [Asparagus officinalis]|uniref:Serine-threonine/tyrosine-protein kinase catalytic domain-containing protein n=1 Tax=Asparagus officinalis TaxID=4686 RepID=A0A5P1EL59_ASPOF|nr:uncharacterized protein A4U43_C06F10410 [Asparagus officinalis]